MTSHRVLVIDDDAIRNKRITTTIKEQIENLEVHSADSFNSGKEKLKESHYFAVLMDMALPLRSGEKRVDPKAGVKLLNGLTRARYKAVPNRVIGFTALLENKAELEKDFEALGFQLHEATRADYTWLDNAVKQIQYSLNAASAYDKLPSDIAVLSVHGIETSGEWQEQLHSQIEKQNPGVQISHLKFKFEKFPMARFLIPQLRKKMVIKLTNDLGEWVTQNEARRIVCFAHSFGTYILVHALERLSGKHTFDNLDLVVLSGSVLKQSHDFSKLLSLKNVRIVNECGKQDVPLLLSKAFVLGAGMGGRLGFNGLMNERFVSRGYQGGHSVFFENDCEIMKKHWLPLLDANCSLEAFNFSKSESSKDRILEYLVRFISKFKYFFYVASLIGVLVVVWNVIGWFF